MASYTPNYNLKKPAGTENINVSDINGNMDILDSTMKTISDNVGHMVDSKYVSLNSSVSQYNVNVPVSSQFLMVGVTSSTARCWATIVIVYSTGTVYLLELAKGSGVTLSADTGKLVVSTSSSGVATVYVFSHNSSKLADVTISA